MLSVFFGVNASGKDSIINHMVTDNGSTDKRKRLSGSRELMKLAGIVDSNIVEVTREHYKRLEQISDYHRNELMECLFDNCIYEHLIQDKSVIVPMHLALIKESNNNGIVYDILPFYKWFQGVDLFLHINASTESILRRIKDDIQNNARDRILPSEQVINEQKAFTRERWELLKEKYPSKKFLEIDNSDGVDLVTNAKIIKSCLPG